MSYGRENEKRMERERNGERGKKGRSEKGD